MEEALTALGGEESVLRVRVMARLAAALRDQPTFEPRATLSSQAVDIARRLGDKVALADALMSHFAATWTPDAERLLPIAEEVGRLAEEARDSERAFQASFLEFVASFTLGEPEHVADLMERHRALAGVLKQPRCSGGASPCARRGRCCAVSSARRSASPKMRARRASTPRAGTPASPTGWLCSSCGASRAASTRSRA